MMTTVNLYRVGDMPLNSAIQRIEGLGRIIDGRFWNENLFPLIVDLERINSEIINRSNGISESEKEKVLITMSIIDQEILNFGGIDFHKFISDD